MALTDRDTSLNYLGELFMVGAQQTPFLNRIGGIGGANAKLTKSTIFPIGQTWSPAAASIPAIDEDEFVTAGTADTVARAQVLNTVMAFQRYVTVSDWQQAATGELAGLSAVGTQPVLDEFGFQKMAQLKRMALDMEKCFLSGVYATADNSSTAAQTRGIITACTSNTVAAGGVKVTKAMVDALLLEMATNGAAFENMIMLVNGFNKGAITDIYNYVPESRTDGGANIQHSMTNFCDIEVVYDPQVPASTILIADLNYINPVFMPVNGQAVNYKDLAETAGARNGLYQALAGIDYGHETLHGTITGTAVS